MTDPLHLRWLVFSATKPYPRSIEDVFNDVYEQHHAHPLTALITARELDNMIESDIIIVHARDSEDKIMEVRLSDDQGC